MTCCIVIPVYRKDPTDTELQSVRRTFSVFRPQRDIYYLVPAGLDMKAYPKAGIIEAPAYFFTGKESYSELCCRPDMYENFMEYDFMLICQPDCWIFRDDLDRFMAMDYDYIGAPWPAGVAAHYEAVGNGGLSLRRVEKFWQICQDIPSWRLRHPEDKFFCFTCATRLKIASVPDAAMFSMEHQAAQYYEHYGLPMGCHRPWEWDYETFWRPILKEYGYEEK